jgi:murein DD-endopeptidase MepM/ murein hydrolase activator NlpD
MHPIRFTAWAELQPTRCNCARKESALRLSSLARLPLVALALVAAAPLAAPVARADYIADFAPDFRPFFKDAEVATPVDRWRLPFDVPDRTSVKGYKLVSTYGSPRLSVVRGHVHTATDMAPAPKPNGPVYVYAMAPGVVVSIHLGAPHLTVVVKHKLADGSTLFTSYKHLHDATVQIGQTVDADTRVGRLFTRQETKALGGDYDHLHLEIRKSFDDYGVASWASMNRAEADKRFLDPAAFLAAHLGKP